MNSTTSQESPSQPPISIAIIGGGLGGLTLAHLLRHTDYKINVFERDKDQFSRGQGYYIGLNPEPINILKTFIPHIPNLSHTLTEADCPSKFIVVDGSLRELIIMGGDDGNKLVNRWGLRECLTQNLNHEIFWGKKFQNYEETSDGVIIYFEDGTTHKFDLVVGADGALSGVRKQRCPQLRNDFIGIVGCVGTLDFPENPEELKEIKKLSSQGFLRILGSNGHTFLVFRFHNQKTSKMEILWGLSWPAQPGDLDEISWKMSKSSDPSVLESIDDVHILKKLHLYILQKANLYFKHREITTMIQYTPMEKLKNIRKTNSSDPHTHNPLGKTTRVTLLGDAIHPMTTHRGLGANTAILDAKDLAMALIKAGSTPEQGMKWRDYLEEYETVMVKRGFKAVKDSLMGTRMIHCKGWKAWVRNWILWVLGRMIKSYGWFGSWLPSWKRK